MITPLRITHFRASAASLLPAACALALLAAPASAAKRVAPASAPAAAPAPPRTPSVPVAVKVTRVRPAREVLATMRFLRTNRDFFRARLDLLRATPVESSHGAEPVDPRFLAWRDLLASAQAAGDSVAAAADADQRRTLFASVTDLGALETQLDQMDRLLAAQRVRLASLEADFAGLQRTALAVVVSGAPASGLPGALELAFDDGTRVDVPLDDAQRATLAGGGVLEVFHGLIEPREQSFALTLGAAAADTGFVTLSPEKDRLTFLRLDLSGAGTANGAAGIVATTWPHDAAPDLDRERANRP